jgi:hypothetical protein
MTQGTKVTGTKTRTHPQAERQRVRSSAGKYEKLNPCEVCGRGAGASYYSDERVNGCFEGRGLVLCQRCAERLGGLDDAAAAKLLGIELEAHAIDATEAIQRIEAAVRTFLVKAVSKANRRAYRRGVAWIALNDSAGDNESAAKIARYISTCLLADVHDVTPLSVARDVVKFRGSSR